jgi:hypothetical protein
MLDASVHFSRWIRFQIYGFTMIRCGDCPKRDYRRLG